MFIGYLISSLVKCIFQFLDHVSICLTDEWEFFIYPVYVPNTFSRSVACLFTFLMVILDEQKLLVLMESSLISPL